MGMQDFSRHQQGIIKRYYDNIDAIQLQKLAETVTDLFLAEGKKREKLWKSAAAMMEKMGVPKAKVEALLAKNDVAGLAKVVQEMQGG